MKIDALALASRLSDEDLLVRLAVLAANERTAVAEVVAHLAALDSRPWLYAAQGYGSLFSYCTHLLRLSEDATCNRIEAARACRRFPAILDRLASGALSLTSVRILSPHLSAENYEGVLARADGRSRREIEALVAELAPRPDVPSTVRKLPAPKLVDAATASVAVASIGGPETPAAAPLRPPFPPAISSPIRRPIIEMTSPERYRVQFTLGRESHDQLRRLQDLLRREIPDGDPATIVARALTLLLEKVENQKCGAISKRYTPAKTTDLPSIRPGADRVGWRRVAASRHIPRAPFSVRCASAMVTNAPMSPRTAADAPNGPSWNSITSTRTRLGDRRRSTTSPYAAAATINTRPSWTSALARGRPIRKHTTLVERQAAGIA